MGGVHEVAEDFGASRGNGRIFRIRKGELKLISRPS